MKFKFHFLIITISITFFSQITFASTLNFYQKNIETIKIEVLKIQAEREENYAINNLALIYLQGQYVQQNFQKAFELLTKAANKNYAPAISNLGQMYLKGQYVQKDLKKAKLLFKQSCLNNYKISCDYYQVLNQGSTDASP